VETVTWFLPKQKLSDKAIDLFDSLRSLFKDLLDMKIDFEYFENGKTIQDQISGKRALRCSPRYMNQSFWRI
jgi:hypothetical protein